MDRHNYSQPTIQPVLGPLEKFNFPNDAHVIIRVAVGGCAATAIHRGSLLAIASTLDGPASPDPATPLAAQPSDPRLGESTGANPAIARPPAHSRPAIPEQRVPGSIPQG